MEYLVRQNKTLEAVNQILKKTIYCQTTKEVAEECLEVAIALTSSKMGLIKIIINGQVETIFDPKTKICNQNIEEPSGIKPGSIWQEVLEKNKFIIVNDI
jgi:hypothetical protein